MKIIPKDCKLVLVGEDPSGRALTIAQKIKELKVSSVDWPLYQNFAQRDRLFRLLKKDVLRVWIPDGIGDLHWVFLKLAALKAGCEASELIIVKKDISAIQDYSKRKDRVLPFLEMNPIIDAIEMTTEQPRIFEEGFVIDDMGFDYAIDPNPFLLTGARIERFLPGLEIDWDYMKRFSAYDKTKVLTGPPIMYFGDRFAEVTWGGSWTDKDWAELTLSVRALSRESPIAVGLESDVSKSKGVANAGGAFTNLVGGTDFEECFKRISRSKLVVGSISGLTIISAALGVPTVALWPDKASLQPLPKKMRSSWVREEIIGGTYFSFGYSSPTELVIHAIKGLL